MGLDSTRKQHDNSPLSPLWKTLSLPWASLGCHFSFRWVQTVILLLVTIFYLLVINNRPCSSLSYIFLNIFNSIIVFFVSSSKYLKFEFILFSYKNLKFVFCGLFKLSNSLAICCTILRLVLNLVYGADRWNKKKYLKLFQEYKCAHRSMIWQTYMGHAILQCLVHQHHNYQHTL